MQQALLQPGQNTRRKEWKKRREKQLSQHSLPGRLAWLLLCNMRKDEKGWMMEKHKRKSTCSNIVVDLWQCWLNIFPSQCETRRNWPGVSLSCLTFFTKYWKNIWFEIILCTGMKLNLVWYDASGIRAQGWTDLKLFCESGLEACWCGSGMKPWGALTWDASSPAPAASRPVLCNNNTSSGVVEQ